jgi:exopolysaccharide production protein ExoZ
LPGLHALRGAAALAVLIHHIDYFGHKVFGDPAFPPGIGLGWFGVDVFFVLSGFIMAHTTAHAPQGPSVLGQFLTARLGRIYPPYWAALALMIFLAQCFPTIFAGYFTNNWASDLLLFPAATAPSLVPAWTLIMELSFYGVFATLLLAPAALRPWLIGLWALLVAAAALVVGAPGTPLAATIINPKVLEFLAGAAIAYITARGIKIAAWPAIALGGAGLFVGAFLVGRLVPAALGDFSDEWMRAALTGVPAALLIYGVAARDRMGAWPNIPILSALGDRSYALYLAHFPIVVAAAALSSQHLGNSPSVHLAYAALAFWLSFLVTEALHQIVEKPSHNWARALSRRIGALAPAPGHR